MPSANASTKTFSSWTSTRSVITRIASETSVQRTQAGSSCARGGTERVVGSAMMTCAPALDEVDGEEGHERHAQEHAGDGGRLAVGELLESRDDEHRRDLRPVRHVAGDEDDR